MIDYYSSKELKKAKREHAFYKGEMDKLLAGKRSHEYMRSTASEQRKLESKRNAKDKV